MNLTDTEIKCEFCGSPLIPRFIDAPFELQNGVNKLQIGYEPCECPQSIEQLMREEAARKAAAAMDAERRRVERYRNAGIPPKYLSAHANTAQGCETVMGGRGLFIQGDNGTLKTTYAAALSKAVINAGKSVLFTSSSRMKGELFSTSRDNTEEDLFRRWVRPYLLVIDDLGKECANKVVVPMLYRVINERDEQMKPIVVTSNFDKAELGERLAECGDVSCAKAIVSRLFGMTDKMVFGGGDRRLL